ncbi:MAG: lipocalin family protein [Bacteroidaceae bacterium]|nr:lipocalin family protein [Bacteroidaceae bacterium]
MKKILFWSMMLLMVMALPVMVACGDDEDTVDLNEIEGTWMCVKSTDSYQGQSVDGLLVGAEITIRSNGTYTSTSDNFGRSGTYTYNGETFTAKSNTGDTFIVKIKVKGNDMNWVGTASNGVSFNYSFKRE